MSASHGPVAHDFWAGKRVLITGHTGFKGGWLALWLQRLGAEVHGLALPPDTDPALFHLARVAEGMTSRIGDIRDLATVRAAMHAAAPEIVFHLAAQPLVRRSYETPVETFATNIMGTAHCLEGARECGTVRTIVVVTSDKCYEDQGLPTAHRETDPLGGHDPYSSSKACAELVTQAYRRSYGAASGIAIATARAGNVIGGGDWSADRLVPDCLRAFARGEPAVIRSPDAIRPWQHLLDPLAGYLRLAERLHTARARHDGLSFAEGWNFGPEERDAKPVRWIVDQMVARWGHGARWTTAPGVHPHETLHLTLDSTKARTRLDWHPRWDVTAALDRTLAWHEAMRAGHDLRATSLAQIADYERAA